MDGENVFLDYGSNSLSSEESNFDGFSRSGKIKATLMMNSR